MIVPSIVLSLAPMGYIARLVRAAVVETLEENYVQTARAKGLYESQILWGHVFPQLARPVLSAAMPMLALLITGALFVEQFFGIPEAATAFLDAARTRDFPIAPRPHGGSGRDRPRGQPAGRPRLGPRSTCACASRRPDEHALLAACRDDARGSASGAPALILLGLILTFVLFWPVISPYDPNEVNFDLSRQGPRPRIRSAPTSSAATS